MITLPALRTWSRRLVTAVVAAAVFLFSWLLRYNDPSGAFGGLTDDHWFYLVRGWQILFGELPVRDFVDHGAPGYFYVGAAVQTLIGRGTWSELMFSTTLLSVSAALTFWLAARASGSIVFGLIGALFQIFLGPRFYNYPKLLVYVAAIPALWAYADRPAPRRLFWVALAAAAGFMLRHDHVVFVSLGMFVLCLVMRSVPWRQRAAHALIYTALVVALLSPYLLFLQLNGGVVEYVQGAASWAERDRGRAEVVWPGLFDNPDGVSEAATTERGLTRWRAIYHDNFVAWQYYGMLALPIVGLLVLAFGRSGFRPDWPRAGEKMLMVAVLGAALNAGFFRQPLEARLADPSVAHAILIAWLGATVVRAWVRRDVLRPWAARHAWTVRVATLLIALPCLSLVALLLADDTYERLDKSSLVDRPRNAFERAAYITERMEASWPLDVAASGQDGTMKLAAYLMACTERSDRIFLTPYLPQVLTMADRAFAGGHADLRSGFFETEADQQLTIARLRRQSVPLVVFDRGEEPGFRASYPLIVRYLEEQFERVGERELTDRTTVVLLVNRERPVTGRYAPLDLPCFR